ncbi:hypothetical protein D5F01_LYC23719 [Larimichthys crocea]|uniref:LINE-1 type transposase domain-containing protein 1 n=1 Tax=Larimichthys crocea TaxID=215358 RepID=A0A6G0HGQ3_LARCR|nr:hypothetical protein D5F01_LYC23719 [Larimichthys crocea]
MERRTSKDADQDTATTEHGESELCGAKEEILLAIRCLNSRPDWMGSDGKGWLPEALDLAPLRCPILLERAHRVGPRRDAGDPPRTLIMKFQSYKQKMLVMKAAKEKKDVRLYNDLATEVHRQRKKYDNVRQQLRSLGLRHGIMPPAKLVVTYREQTHTFNMPTEAQEFINKIKEERGGNND